MNELVTLKKIEQSKLAILEARTLDEIKTLVDQTEAIKAYLKSANATAEIQSIAAEINIRALKRMGEITKKIEVSKGGQPYQKKSTLENENRVETKTETLAALGIDIHTANEAERFAKVPDDYLETKLTEARKVGENITKSLASKIEKQYRQGEFSRALDRVAHYRKTGVKPKGWIDGKDDDLNRQADERDARLEAYWQEKADKQERQQESANGEFLVTLRAYLKGLTNDDLRAGACNAVIKECRKILGGLGKN